MISKSSALCRRIHDAVEHPWVYDLNQLFWGTGKK
jgi:hypothetical protein